MSVWNSEDGKNLGKLEHQSPVKSVAFHDDLIATCANDKVVIIWSSSDYSRISLIPVYEMLESIVFLPEFCLENYLGAQACSKENPMVLTAGQSGKMNIIETKSKRCVLKINSPTESFKVSSTEEDKEKQLFTLNSVVTCQIIPEKSILALTRQNNHVEFYDLLTVKLKKEFLGDVCQVSKMSLVGKSFQYLLLSDTTPNLKLFTKPPHVSSTSEQEYSWECYLVPGGHDGTITCLGVADNGEWAVTGGKDRKICLWNVDEQTKFGSFDVSLNLKTKVDNAHVGHIACLSFFRVSKQIVSVCDDLTLKVWILTEDSTDLKELCSTRNVHNAAVNDISVSINDKCIATASKDKTIKIWDVKDNGIEVFGCLVGHKKAVRTVEFSSEERMLLSASADCDVRLWNLKDLSCIQTFEGHSQPLVSAKFLSESKRIISCDQNGIVRIWDVTKKNEILYSANDSSQSESGNLHIDENSYVQAMALKTDFTGFYIATDDSTLHFYKDESERLMLEKLQREEQLIEYSQKLANYIQDKKFADAVIYALEMDQPRRLFSIIQEAQTEGLTAEGIFDEAFERIKQSSDNLPRLLNYIAYWNTRARSSALSQRLLKWIFIHWSPEEICSTQGVSKYIESLISYSSRHRRRYKNLACQLHIMDYFKEIVNETKLEIEM